MLGLTLPQLLGAGGLLALVTGAGGVALVRHLRQRRLERQRDEATEDFVEEQTDNHADARAREDERRGRLGAVHEQAAAEVKSEAAGGLGNYLRGRLRAARAGARPRPPGAAGKG